MLRVFVGLLAAMLFSVWAGAAVAAPPPLEAYGRLPDLEHVSLSPSGGRLAMVKVVGEDRRLVVMEPTGRILVNAAIGEVKIAELDWAGDSHLMVTKHETMDGGIDFGWNDHEVFATLVVNVDTQKQFWALRNGSRPGAVMGEYGVRRIGERWVGFFGGRDSHFMPTSLYEVDFTTGDTRRVRLGTRTSAAAGSWA